MTLLRYMNALSVPAALVGFALTSFGTAQAGSTQSITCAGATGGVTVNSSNDVSITVAVGDRLSVTAAAGNQALNPVTVRLPDASVVEVDAGTTVSETIEAGDEGTFLISGNGGINVATVICTLAVVEGAEVEAGVTTQDVQRVFTSRQMMSHLSNLYDDVHRNTSGVLSGTGTQNVSQNGLFLQSVGKAAKDIPGAQPSLNVFVSAEVTSFDGDSFDGLTGDLTLGLDYRVSRDVVVGALVSAGRADFSTLIGTTVGGLESTGLTVGAYAAAIVFGDVTVDGIVSYSGLSYDVASGTTTGDFDANRLGISVGVYNQMPFMGATLEPHARVTYGMEEQDGYTDSTGTAVGSTTINAGRITFGPRLIAPTINGFTPWISASGVYEFSDAGNLVTGAPDFDDTFSGTVGLGFDWASDLGRIGGEIEFGGLGSGVYTSVGGTVNYTLSF